MNPWKTIRLAVCIALIVAFLAVGGYARLVWGVPEAPYGTWESNVQLYELTTPLSFDPFVRLRRDMEPIEERGVVTYTTKCWVRVRGEAEHPATRE